jgi:plastocyanin
MCRGLPRTRLNLTLLALASITAVSVALPAWAALPNTVRVILQKGRQYNPADLFLHRGDTLTFVNGDDVAVHHAFIEADRFTFDGGDQEPGTNRTLTLTKAGDFVIRCGIHPKMKLTIHVQ